MSDDKEGSAGLGASGGLGGRSPPGEVETRSPRKLTGFARLSPERRREIARSGGLAAHASGVGHCFDRESAAAAGRVAHERGTAHVWTTETARAAGRKGGKAYRERVVRDKAAKAE